VINYSSTLTLAALLALLANSNAKAEPVLLSCWGTVELMQQGKRVNPKDEKSSIAVAVDVARKMITINDVQWPMFGEVTKETIVSMDPNKGSITLNRITGAISAHFIEFDGLKKFYGECKSAQKLF
jgi:1-aminocyclopropane-1-carboxylate deaminase/D-cysteine desulfhydrase-like pyridoxal-dependent ACC family enzyme